MPRYDDDHDYRSGSSRSYRDPFADDDADDFHDIRRKRRDEYGESSPSGEMPQSGMGICSLLISIGVGILMFILVAVAGVMVSRPNPPRDDDPVMILVGLGIMGGQEALALIGLVLGFVGAMQSNRRGLCGVLGAVFNGLILLGVGALMCIGIAMG